MINQQSDVPPEVQRQLSGAIDAFVMKFRRRPTFAAFAPGRINLIGEHTDYNNGFVLPMTIQRHTIVIADLARGRQSHAWAIDLGEDAEFDLTRPVAPRPGQSANYLLSVAKQFQSRGHTLPNIEMIVTSTIPIGGGLSSSAALEVAFATLLEQILQVDFSPRERAELCQQAEHDFPATPVGIMDMLAISSAQRGRAMLIDCRDLNVQLITMPDADDVSIVVANTVVRHDLADGGYADRRATCAAAASALKLSSLRDADLAMLQRGTLSAEQHKRALHVISENTRTVLAASHLARGDLRSFGELMFASHDSLRDLYQVTCPELDVLVDAARELQRDGVLGARMTGGGFGGCIIVLCRNDAIDHVRNRLTLAYQGHFGRECEIFTSTAAGSARALRV